MTRYDEYVQSTWATSAGQWWRTPLNGFPWRGQLFFMVDFYRFLGWCFALEACWSVSSWEQLREAIVNGKLLANVGLMVKCWHRSAIDHPAAPKRPALEVALLRQALVVDSAERRVLGPAGQGDARWTSYHILIITSYHILTFTWILPGLFTKICESSRRARTVRFNLTI